MVKTKKILIEELFNSYAKILSNKVKVGFLTSKTRSEYLYLTDKLEKYLMSFDEETNEKNILNRIYTWNNDNRNSAVVGTIKRQLKLKFFDLSS